MGGNLQMVYDLSFLTVCICSDPYLEYTDKLTPIVPAHAQRSFNKAGRGSPDASWDIFLMP